MNNSLESKKRWPMVAAVVAVVVLLVGGALLMWKNMGGDADIKKDQYQALFLTNGQVYFGKLSNVNDKYVELSNIYYLQVQQSVQPANNDKDKDPQVSLAKLGSELHGPEDKMLINRDQVLFWENLKNDSKVVDTINKNK